MSIRWEVSTSVAFGPGRLVVKHRVTRQGAHRAAESQAKSIVVQYVEGKREISVGTLKDIGRIAREHKLSIVDEAAGYEDEWADLVARLLDTGRVVHSNPLWLEMPRVQRIVPEMRFPRIEESVLCFLAIPFRLDNLDPPVISVCVDLNTLLVRTCEVSKSSICE